MVIEVRKPQRILVMGGTGYIGQAVVDRLDKEGCQIVVFSRDPKRREHKEGVTYIKGSMLDKKFLLENLKNFDVVIYLAAIVRTLNKARYRENIVGLENVLETMRVNELNKIVYFSTQNVYIEKTGPYGKSKKICEEIIHNTLLDYNIIRPNYVYGIDRHNDFYKLYKIMEKTKICPLIGSGNTRIQPLNKSDLAEITIRCIKEWHPGVEINVSGRKVISIKQAVDIIKRQAGIKCMLLHLPVWILRLCKFAIPFDIDGYTEDRVFTEGADAEKGGADIEEDISRMIAL